MQYRRHRPVTCVRVRVLATRNAPARPPHGRHSSASMEPSASTRQAEPRPTGLSRSAGEGRDRPIPHVWYPVWQSRRRTGSSQSSLRCCTSATSSSQARRSLLERPSATPMRNDGRSIAARRRIAWSARCIAVLYADDSTARNGRGRRCVHGSCARRLRERSARVRA